MSQNSQKNTCARFSLQNVKRKTAATIHLQMGSKSTLLLFSENRWNSWIYINSQIHIGQSHLDYSRIPPKQIKYESRLEVSKCGGQFSLETSFGGIRVGSEKTWQTNNRLLCIDVMLPV